MTLNSTGPISLAGTQTGISVELEIKEIGPANQPISLGDALVRDINGVLLTPGTTISMSDLRGHQFYHEVISVTPSVIKTGQNFSLQITGGLPSDSYTVALNGVTVATGQLSASGTVTLTLTTSVTGSNTITAAFTTTGHSRSLVFNAIPPVTYAIFTQSAQWTAPSSLQGTLQVLVVGGGGGGGEGGPRGCQNGAGGGGGGGGVVQNCAVTVTAGETYTIMVGGGGGPGGVGAPGGDGVPSSAFGYTAYGGGGGGGATYSTRGGSRYCVKGSSPIPDTFDYSVNYSYNCGNFYGIQGSRVIGVQGYGVVGSAPSASVGFGIGAIVFGSVVGTQGSGGKSINTDVLFRSCSAPWNGYYCATYAIGVGHVIASGGGGGAAGSGVGSQPGATGGPQGSTGGGGSTNDASYDAGGGGGGAGGGGGGASGYGGGLAGAGGAGTTSPILNAYQGTTYISGGGAGGVHGVYTNNGGSGSGGNSDQPGLTYGGGGGGGGCCADGPKAPAGYGYPGVVLIKGVW